MSDLSKRRKGLSELAEEIVDLIDEPSGTPRPRSSDPRLAHLTPGELVVPTSLLDARLMALICAEARQREIDPRSLFVGSGRNAINPRTGLPEFQTGDPESGDSPPPVPSPDSEDDYDPTTDPDMQPKAPPNFWEHPLDWIGNAINGDLARRALENMERDHKTSTTTTRG